jgi:hypothetical protein
LIGAVTSLAYIPIAVILGLLVVLSAGLAAFSGTILNYVLSPTFISWSYTNPANNQLIKLGLDITQPLANMVLVLVLVFIALTTILRLAGYETKKLLPTFIIVALLVNFSPVILGVMVDASNIVMNFFVQDITGGKHFLGMMTSLSNTLYARAADWRTFNVTEQPGAVLELVVLIVINFSLFLVLLAFALILMLRYIMIWVLVILSPIAFVCYILPPTKRIWSLWWNTFVQWLLIGVNLVFFLYLADQFAALNPQIAAQGAGATGVGGILLPAITPLLVYFVGFFMAMAKLPSEMSAINGFVKWAGVVAGVAIGAKAGRGTRTWLEENARIREGVGKVVHPLEKVPIARVFIPEAVRRYAEIRPAVEEGIKEAGPYASPIIANRIAAGADYGVKAVGGMAMLTQRGDMNDLFKAYKEKYKVGTDEELYQIPEFREKMKRLLWLTQTSGYRAPILRGDPRLARFAPEAKLAGYEDLSPEQAVAKTVREARANM